MSIHLPGVCSSSLALASLAKLNGSLTELAYPAISLGFSIIVPANADHLAVNASGTTYVTAVDARAVCSAAATYICKAPGWSVRYVG